MSKQTRLIALKWNAHRTLFSLHNFAKSAKRRRKRQHVAQRTLYIMHIAHNQSKQLLKKMQRKQPQRTFDDGVFSICKLTKNYSSFQINSCLLSH